MVKIKNHISSRLERLKGICDAKCKYIITHLSATIYRTKQKYNTMYSCYLRIKYNNPYRVMRIPSFKVTLQHEAQYASN